MSKCQGNSEDHCCYIGGKVCPHLEINTVLGRHWVCGLLRRLGSWEAVYASPEWQRDIWVIAAQIPSLGPEFRCGDWPPAGVKCESCGVTGG